MKTYVLLRRYYYEGFEVNDPIYATPDWDELMDRVQEFYFDVPCFVENSAIYQENKPSMEEDELPPLLVKEFGE